MDERLLQDLNRELGRQPQSNGAAPPAAAPATAAVTTDREANVQRDLGALLRGSPVAGITHFEANSAVQEPLPSAPAASRPAAVIETIPEAPPNLVDATWPERLVRQARAAFGAPGDPVGRVAGLLRAMRATDEALSAAEAQASKWCEDADNRNRSVLAQAEKDAAAALATARADADRAFKQREAEAKSAHDATMSAVVKLESTARMAREAAEAAGRQYGFIRAAKANFEDGAQRTPSDEEIDRINASVDGMKEFIQEKQTILESNLNYFLAYKPVLRVDELALIGGSLAIVLLPIVFGASVYSEQMIVLVGILFLGGMNIMAVVSRSSPMLRWFLVIFMLCPILIIVLSVTFMAIPVAIAIAIFIYFAMMRPIITRLKALHRTSAEVDQLSRAMAQRTQAKLNQDVAEAKQGQNGNLAAAQSAHDQAVAAQHAASGRRETAIAECSDLMSAIVGQAIANSEIALEAEANSIAAEVETLAPGWASPAWTDEVGKKWTPATEAPAIIRFGSLQRTWRGKPQPLPAIGRFPSLLPLWIDTKGGATDAAAEGVQDVLLRLLLQSPPAAVKLTLFDAVGLGKNVAAVTPLIDTNPNLIDSRAWNEPEQFARHLQELTDRISEVHQKFLRKEFDNIEAYNRTAKVPQPYHILAVINFPANFTPETANRLKSIMESGPACGIYPIVTCDAGRKPPHDVNLDDFRRRATVIRHENGAFALVGEDFAGCALRFEALPEQAVAKPLLDRVGAAAEAAARVEVPFSEIAPERWWAEEATTRDGVRTPIGLAGATKRLQLALGRDTAQHVLIAGRTGSGKSTLLHVLITSLALTYSPQELELYLIDFKEGVEFKTYAEHRLPHARVVAIETEREFGLSVLRRLDRQLEERGKRFRACNEQNIAGFRAETGETLPRVLLIVDEFQEFFVEDDSLAREAGTILDRLVRQGRAFGIHVLLGSQTLAGSASLPRSTIDQMGVRIALQCSEADSRLILSEDNPMARLLSRAGEAIYNDHNGRIEGNSLFQTVWLSDEMRDDYLRRIADLVAKRDIRLDQTVFEGNAPAAIEQNASLRASLAEPTWDARAPRLLAWIGDPIEIKVPTAAVFRSQSASNLVIVGQDEDAALGIAVAGLASLAAQIAPAAGGAPQFSVLDLTAVDSPRANLLERVLSALPHSSRLGHRRQVAEIVRAVAAEVDRRMEDEDAAKPPIFLFVHGAMRARDLRPDDAGFAPAFFNRDPLAAEREAPLSERFARIVREGPDLGVHTIVWCDSVTNLNRVIDQRSLREFDLRIAFQMGAEDSGRFIDAMAASKLGPHRALYFSEEMGALEKFRPYGIPSDEWIDGLRQELAGNVELRSLGDD